jgi:hypothetical protein
MAVSRFDSSDLTDGVPYAVRSLSLHRGREKEDEPGQTISTNKNHVRAKIRKKACG